MEEGKSVWGLNYNQGLQPGSLQPCFLFLACTDLELEDFI